MKVSSQGQSAQANAKPQTEEQSPPAAAATILWLGNSLPISEVARPIGSGGANLLAQGAILFDPKQALGERWDPVNQVLETPRHDMGVPGLNRLIFPYRSALTGAAIPLFGPAADAGTLSLQSNRHVVGPIGLIGAQARAAQAPAKTESSLVDSANNLDDEGNLRPFWDVLDAGWRLAVVGVSKFFGAPGEVGKNIILVTTDLVELWCDREALQAGSLEAWGRDVGGLVSDVAGAAGASGFQRGTDFLAGTLTAGGAYIPNNFGLSPAMLFQLPDEMRAPLDLMDKLFVLFQGSTGSAGMSSRIWRGR
jgi:hypothetical protein